MATVLVIAAIAVALVVASLLRRAPRGRCLVVTRRRRIVRIASDSMTMAVPGFHEVLEWPTEEIEIPIVIRTRTGDGQDVRILATFTVDVDPPQLGAAYVDPRDVIRSAVERQVADAVHARSTDQLLDERDGLAVALDGARLGGLASGVVTDVVVDEVEVLLHPGHPDHNDG